MISPLDELIARDRQREQNRRLRQRQSLHHQITMTRVYERAGDYHVDAQRLRRHGWRVQRAWQRPPRVSLDRIRAGSPLALVHYPASEFVAVYSRPAMAGERQPGRRETIARAALASQRRWWRGRRALGRSLVQAGAFIAGVCAVAELERSFQDSE